MKTRVFRIDIEGEEGKQVSIGIANDNVFIWDTVRDENTIVLLEIFQKM